MRSATHGYDPAVGLCVLDLNPFKAVGPNQDQVEVVVLPKREGDTESVTAEIDRDSELSQISFGLEIERRLGAVGHHRFERTERGVTDLDTFVPIV